MAERLAYLEAVIGADITQFRKGMRDIRNETGILSETISGISGAARTATFAISAPLATLGTYTVQAANDFDAAMRNINSITGMSEGELNKLSDAVREFSSTTRGGAVDAANSLYTVFSAGITDMELAMNTMEVATKTADAGLADMETTTEALVASMLSYGTEVVSAERASDSLTQMVQIGVGSMQNFANSLSKALPSAAALGVEIEDLYASMAYMTQRSFSASEAATAINQGMSSLMKPTEDMEKAMRSLGVNGVEELMSKYNSLGNAVKALVETTDGSSASIAKLFSNIRGKRFVDTILNDFETYTQTMEEFNRTVEGATDRAYEEQMKSFAAQWDLMTSAVENASIAIGLELLPVLAPVIGKIAELFTALSQLEPITLKMGVAFAGLLVVVPPLIWLLSSMVNPLGALIALFGVVTANMVSAQGGIASFIDNLDKSVPALRNIRTEIERIFGEPYQTQTPTPEDLGLYSYEYAPVDFATMQSGDTIWDYFLTRTDTNQTWDEFKDEWIARNGKLTFSAGDLVELPTGSFMEWVGEELMSASELGEAYRKQQVYTSDFYEMNTDTESWNAPLELQMLQLRQALDDNIKPAIMGIGTQISNWFSNSFNLALMAIDEFGAELFAGITNILNTMMQDYFAGKIDTDIISNIIGDLFAINPTAPFANLTTSLDTFFKTFVDWTLTYGIPTLLRGLGRLTGELVIFLVKALRDSFEWITNNFSSVGGNLSYLGSSILQSFQVGFQDAMNNVNFNFMLLVLAYRFQQAFPVILSTIDTLGANLISFFNTMFTDFTRWLGTFLTPQTLSDAIGNLFDFNPVKEFQTAFPDMTKGLATLFNNVSTWVIATGLPILGRGFGRLVGELGIFFLQGFNSLLNSITRNNSITNVWNTLVNSLFRPMVLGLQDAFFSAFGGMDLSFAFVMIFRNIMLQLERIFYNLLPIVADIFNTLKTTILSMLPTIDLVLDSIFATLGNIVSNLTGQLDTTALGDLITTFFNVHNLLPNATAELQKLMESAGAWLASDGIPFLANGLGSFVANFGLAIRQAFGYLGQTLQGIIPTTVGGATDSFAIPFLDGFNTAIGEYENQTGDDVSVFDTLLTGIAGAIGTAALLNPSFFADAAMDIGKALMRKLAETTVVSTALKAGSAFFTSVTGLIGGFFASTTFSVILGTLALAGLIYLLIPEDTMKEIERQLGILIQGAEFTMREDINVLLDGSSIGFAANEEMKKQMVANMNPVIAQMFEDLPYQLQLDLTQLFANETLSLEELDVVLQGLNLTLNLGSTVEDAIRTPLLTEINEAIKIFNAVERTTNEGALEDAIILPEFTFALPKETQDAVIQALLDADFLNIDPEKLALIQQTLLQEYQSRGESDAQAIRYNYYQGIQNGLTGTVTGNETTVLDNPNVVAQTGLVETRFEIFDAQTEAEMIESGTMVGTQVGEGLATSIGAAVASEGMTAEGFKETFLNPFVTNWDTAFGEEGSVRLASQGFFDMYSTGMAGLLTKTIYVSNMIPTPLNKICVEMQDAMSCIKTSMDTARDSVSKLLTEIRKLASVSTSLEISVRVTGTINAPTGETVDVDSSSANGLEYVARDGHIAELHKGEMVVPSTIASNLRRIGDVSKSILDGSIGGGGKGGDTYTTQHNQINIYGVDNVDDLLAELERRGIYL